MLTLLIFIIAASWQQYLQKVSRYISRYCSFLSKFNYLLRDRQLCYLFNMSRAMGKLNQHFWKLCWHSHKLLRKILPRGLFSSTRFYLFLNQGRWKLSQGPRRGQEGRAGPAAPGVHQRVEEAEGQGGGGAQEAEGQAGQEEGDQGRAGEETCPTEEGRRGKIEERGEWEESTGGRGEEEKDGRGWEEEAGDDEGTEGEDGSIWKW